MSPGGTIVALFHRTGDGLLAARVGDAAFLALPRDDGTLRIAYGSRLEAPPEFWTPRDFYGVSRLVNGEDGFRAYVESQAEHRRQLAGLERREVRASAATPWGGAQISWLYAEGIVRHSTAGHGGFHVDPQRNAEIHSAWRNADGWYEEDCEWSKVAVAFPKLFTDYERQCAQETLRNSEPDAYEQIYRVVLVSGQSHVKDERRFKREHAADWIVISAINSTQQPGFVECIATIGGDRRNNEERRFLIPSQEYKTGRFGFVIDLARHAAYDGPG
jgi:hypothetical protein